MYFCQMIRSKRCTSADDQYSEYCKDKHEIQHDQIKMHAHYTNVSHFR